LIHIGNLGLALEASLASHKQAKDGTHHNQGDDQSN
jgi:hypothetical protein